jgi:hypothetical protein
MSLPRENVKSPDPSVGLIEYVFPILYGRWNKNQRRVLKITHFCTIVCSETFRQLKDSNVPPSVSTRVRNAGEYALPPRPFLKAII